MQLVKKLECKFFTATVLEWKYLLKEDTYKEIILNSLQFLVYRKHPEQEIEKLIPY